MVYAILGQSLYAFPRESVTLECMGKLTVPLIMTSVSRGLLEPTSITPTNTQGINGCKPHSKIRACFTEFFLLRHPI